MLDFSRVQNYYIACGYTGMRKQIDGLATRYLLQWVHLGAKWVQPSAKLARWVRR